MSYTAFIYTHTAVLRLRLLEPVDCAETWDVLILMPGVMNVTKSHLLLVSTGSA